MYRMRTLIWALGVMLFASHAQAVTPMGEKAGSIRTAMVSGGQESQSAHLTSRRTKSTKVTKRASRKTAYKKRASRGNARQAKRTHHRARRAVAVGTTMSGKASYYWQRQRVASGGWFNPKGMTAAHKTLPFGTRVKVTNARNGRTVHVTINDRGPYIAGRIIDLSDAAAGAIGMKGAGVVPVQLEVVGR